jgi:hypothetical protein
MYTQKGGSTTSDGGGGGGGGSTPVLTPKKITKINSFINSASTPTIIGRGIYRDKPAYFKFFYNGDDQSRKDDQYHGLMYECRVHSYIDSLDKDVKQFFIGFFGDTDTSIDILLRSGVIDPKDIEPGAKLNERMHELGITRNTNIHLIITEDNGSISLNDFIQTLENNVFENNAQNTKKLMHNIFILIFEAIAILNGYCNIMHNDMHFDNILIKREPVEYQLLDGSILNSQVKISIYDFDKSYLKASNKSADANNNKLYVEEWVDQVTNWACPEKKCNTMSLKDNYIFIMAILMIYSEIKRITDDLHTRYSLLKNYLAEMILTILPQETVDELKLRIEDFKNGGIHWTSYCVHESRGRVIFGLPCSGDKKAQDMLVRNSIGKMYTNFMNWVKKDKKILKTVIIPVTINEKLSEKSIDYIYFTKYLKYKNKYLSLKETKK